MHFFSQMTDVKFCYYPNSPINTNPAQTNLLVAIDKFSFCLVIHFS